MNLYDLDTPALFVDLDRLERNIARAAETAKRGGKTFRPHTKTHKTPEIARMQADAGAAGLTVAKLGEAEVYAASGFGDVFIANEVIGPLKVDRLLRLSERCRVIVGVDSVESAGPISKAAFAAGMCIPVRIEVDTGHHRAGVRSIDDAVRLAARLGDMAGIEIEGVFTHEGHVYKADAADRESLCSAAAEKLRRIRDQISEGSDFQISVGATPSLRWMAQEDGVTELRPGVYVFGDVMQTRLGMDVEDCALSVLATVVSRPEARTAILDSGSKTLSGDRGEYGWKYGLIPQHPEALLDWVSEEHGHLDLSESSWNPRVGEKVRIVPYHACAAANMHDELYAVRGESVETVWKVAARGKFR